MQVQQNLAQFLICVYQPPKKIFVVSKNRIAPLKTLTLPRLELMAAVCSARLTCSILKTLQIKIISNYWTDSKITYFWIKGSREKFKHFCIEETDV